MLAVTGDTAQIAEERAPGWRPLHLWLGASSFLLLIALPQLIAFRPAEPDDYMRLAEVRDLIAGQGWFDVTQYRMDAPDGASMHWSRLVDLPIAASLLLFGLVLPEPWASAAAMTVVPLLQLALAMALLRALVRDLGGNTGAVLAASLLPLGFPLLLSTFLPLRIDHHGWQALAVLAATWLALRGRKFDALAAGAIAAGGLTISLEGLPLAAMLVGLLAGRYWLTGQRGHESFLAGLAVTAPVLGLATRGPQVFAAPICDVVSWPHFAAFAAAALAAWAGTRAPGQDRRTGRLMTMAPIPLLAAPAVLLPLGVCAVDPFAGMDPVVKTLWLDRVGEGLPVWHQPISVAAMLLWTTLVVLAGWRIAERQGSARHGWRMLALLALGTAAYSLLVMRAGLAAQLLAVPFAAVLVAHWWPRVQALGGALPRVAATLGLLLLATPMAASAALKPFDDLSQRYAAPTLAVSAKGASGTCDLADLSALPPAKLFAPLDMGPEILVRTNHGVVAGPYHRNQRAMRWVMDGFVGPADMARAAAKASGAHYLVACLTPEGLGPYTGATPNLASTLLAGERPAWLEPVPGFPRGALQVYRIR